MRNHLELICICMDTTKVRDFIIQIVIHNIAKSDNFYFVQDVRGVDIETR